MHRSPGSDARTWLDEFNSPLIQEDGNNKCLKLRFDVSQYAPEEIVVKTVDNKLLVSHCDYYFFVLDVPRNEHTEFTLINVLLCNNTFLLLNKKILC